MATAEGKQLSGVVDCNLLKIPDLSSLYRRIISIPPRSLSTMRLRCAPPGSSDRTSCSGRIDDRAFADLIGLLASHLKATSKGIRAQKRSKIGTRIVYGERTRCKWRGAEDHEIQ